MADPTDMTVFSLMKSRLAMLGARQKTLAENVANVTTPGYVPKDVDTNGFAAEMQRMASGESSGSRLAMTVTSPGHITPNGRSGVGDVKMVSAPDSETTLDGNSVVVEEQMMKIAETRMEFETMVGLYQKSLGLLKLAARSPGR